ncbi:MAG: 2-oxo acid dehydrogenase subunit E2, partial [Gammaproteobacteria bacterium]
MSKIAALTVPRWGMAMEEGTLVNWLRNEGDTVRDGDEILEMESSKIVNVLQVHSSGTLRRKLAKEGDTLPVGSLLGVISDPDVPDKDIDLFVSKFRPIVSPGAPEIPMPQEPAVAGIKRPSAGASPGAARDETVVPGTLTQGADDGAVPASPHARRFARQLGINLHHVKGTGRGDRIQIEDIERAIIKAGGVLPAATQPAGQDTARPRGATVPEILEETALSGMRQLIARRVKESKLDAPHYRLIMEATADNLLALRKELNDSLPEGGVSVNDLLIKGCAMALMEVPACNI